jgi:energy-coupling factor transporter transmembrane protein EcfT
MSIAVVVTRDIAELSLLLPMPLVLGLLTRPRWKTAIRRCLAIAPLVAASAVFRAWQDGEAARALGMTLQAAACVSAFAVISAAYSPAELVGALRKLGIPASLASILALMDRYISLLSLELSSLRRARASRTTRSMGWLPGLRSDALLFGSLVVRSFHRSERVHAAMVSRGFEGVWPAPAMPPFRARDLWMIVLGLAWIVLARR